MSEQLKAMWLSFLIHSAMLAGVVVLGGTIAPALNKPVLIDFSLEGSCETQKAEGPKRRALMQKASQPSQPVERTPVKEVAAPTMPKVQEAGAPVASATIAATEPAAKGPVASVQPPAQAAAARDEGARTASPSPAYSMSPEGKKASYLKENFTYIRDLINRRVSYPAVARKMGWEGRVTVSFIVSLDGSVRDIRISKSSGRGLLDNNAVETIRNASPFPRPPVEAELVIPIVYKLN